MSETEQAKIYAFDAEYIDVPIEVKLSAERSQILYHRLRRPTLQQLMDRESQVIYKATDISTREQEIESSEEAANARLWEKIVLKVKGYRGANDWVELTDEEKAQMRPGHKTAAIQALYAGSCEIEAAEEGIPIGAETWTVIQKIGLTYDAPDFVIRHILNEPTEEQRLKFKQKASSTLNLKGAQKPQVRVQTRIKPHAELYDTLIQDVTGATVNGVEMGGSSRKDFLGSIDAIWKRLIIQTLMSALEAQISD